MPGGGIQRSVARVYRRMMPHSDAGEGSDRSSGLGRGKGRGKGGPRGVEGRVEAGGFGSLRLYRRLRRRRRRRRRWSLPRTRSGRKSGRRTRRRRESSSAEEEDTAEDTSTLAVWLRGPSRLPDRPIPVALRPLIQPSGDM